MSQRFPITLKECKVIIFPLSKVNGFYPAKSGKYKTKSGPTVAVFDSGLGSLSIVKAIIKKAKSISLSGQKQNFQKFNLIYLADQASFPYGSKTRQQLAKTIKESSLFLRKHFDPDLVIVASNTPSLLIKNLEKRFRVFGVYPPIEDAIIHLRKTIQKRNTADSFVQTSGSPYPYISIAILATHAAIKTKAIDRYTKYTLRQIGIDSITNKEGIIICTPKKTLLYKSG